MGGEGSVGCVANGHMTVGRWGKGGRGRGRGGRGGKGGGGGGRGEEGARQGPDGGPVEPAQHKTRGLATGLKKN